MKEPSFWNDILTKAMTIYANLIFAALWVGFVIALIVNRAWLDEAWTWTQGLPLAPKIVVWVLFLPMTVGLWIWESSWPALGRLAGFAGIAAWTLLAVNSAFKNFR